MRNGRKELWLYSPKHGFRVLDRRWPINNKGVSGVWLVKPAAYGTLLETQDWTVAYASLSEIRKHFKIVGDKDTAHFKILTRTEEKLKELKVLYEQKKWVYKLKPKNKHISCI
jgi:hypothetical protein